MKSTNFFVVKVKNAILPGIFCLFILFMILFSKTNLASAKSGLSLWANSVVPSLLPFFIATELLSHTYVVPLLGRALNGIMRPLFNVPGEGAFAFIMGIISGYPTGAKIVTKFREEGIFTKEEGERLLAFTNNSGPLFIVGTVGISLFGDTRTGILLLITHILACISVGILFRFWKKKKICRTKRSILEIEPACGKRYTDDSVTFSNLGEILGTSIMNSIHTILLIGGFVVLFSVIVSMLKQSNILQYVSTLFQPLFSLFGIGSNFSLALLTGLLELTNGVKEVALITSKAISQNVIICSFLLGFGGLSVLLQVFSITSKSDISIKAYFIGKLLHGAFAAIYTYAFLTFTPFFNLNLF